MLLPNNCGVKEATNLGVADVRDTGIDFFDNSVLCCSNSMDKER
jgi:hypothetical protein